MDREQFEVISKSVDLAIERIKLKGSDDIFKPPIFSNSIESHIIFENPDDFGRFARTQAIDFLKTANLTKEPIGPTRRGLVVKDQHSFRLCAWLDPLDAVKYLATAITVFAKIEAARIPKNDKIIHSHRQSEDDDELFDSRFGYDSFRTRSSELSHEKIGEWKVVTDVANFFDRIGNHALENHLLNVGCDKRYVSLLREMLLFWAGDRRSFGVPVGSDASRILSEAALLDVDRKLHDANVIFLRYVDDFRIFAKTRAEALKSLEVLTMLLADEGLSINNGKTSVFKIVDPEKMEYTDDKIATDEHEKIDIDKRIAVTRRIRVSGRSSISRFYRQPGRDAVAKMKNISKEDLLGEIETDPENQIEQKVKIAVKYFIYIDQDTIIIDKLLERRITSIFYISDAIIKDNVHFENGKRKEISSSLFNAIDWLKCPYPLQVPILRISGHVSYLEPTFVRSIVDSHLQTDNMLFFREAISLGSAGLDRARLRKLAIEVFGNVPPFLQRAIYAAISSHTNLAEDEKRPLMKNMKQHSQDWFIRNM